MARRSGKRWFIAGINGTDEAQTLDVPISRLPATLQTVVSYFDSPGQPQQWDIRMNAPQSLPVAIPCQPRGGFVLVLDEANAQ